MVMLSVEMIYFVDNGNAQIKEFLYSNEERRRNHVGKMESEGWNVGSQKRLFVENRYRWYAEFWKDHDDQMAKKIKFENRPTIIPYSEVKQ